MDPYNEPFKEIGALKPYIKKVARFLSLPNVLAIVDPNDRNVIIHKCPSYWVFYKPFHIVTLFTSVPNLRCWPYGKFKKKCGQFSVFTPHFVGVKCGSSKAFRNTSPQTQRRFFGVGTNGTLMVLVLCQHTRWSKDGMSLPTASPPCCKRLGNSSTLRITGNPAIE